MIVTREQDSYINSLYESSTRWVVTLSDGLPVYCDDDRPGLEPSSWSRLRKFCKTNNLYIVDMFLQFRSHIERLPSNADGYYFVKSILGFFGGENEHFWLTGCLQNGILSVKKFKIPELVEVESEIRNISLDDECFIPKCQT